MRDYFLDPSEYDANDILEEDKKYVLDVGLKHKGLVLVYGKGSTVRDLDGKEYIDFGSSVANMSSGYGNQEIIDAVKKQMDLITHNGFSSTSIPRAKLARLVIEEVFPPEARMKKFCTVGGGSEANETMLKIALQYGAGKNAGKFISWWESYHGATMAALGATAQRSSKTASYEPLMPQFIHVPLPNCDHCDFGRVYPGCGIQCARFVKELVEVEGPDNFAGMLFEPIVSAVGGVVPPREYFEMIRDICRENDILLMFDEVITGFGRTGRLLASQHYGIYPHIMSFGKGFISGYGMGAGVAVNEDVIERGCFADHFHVFTNIGNLLTSAAAYANIRYIIDNDLPGNSEKMGGLLAEGLLQLNKKYPDIIDNIIGRGLLRSIVFKRDIKGGLVDRVTDAALEMGLIINANHRSRGHLIIIMPPLVINEGEIGKGMEIITRSFKKVFGG